jgi:exonuclease SbcD
VQRLPITAGRRLRLLTGTKEEVEAAAGEVGEAIVKVVVSAQDPIDGLVDHLRGLMPDATIVEIIEDVASRRLEPAHHGEAEREQTLDELFDDYLAEHGTRTVPAEQVRSLWQAAQHAIHDEEHRLEVAGLEEVMTSELPVPEEVADAAA